MLAFICKKIKEGQKEGDPDIRDRVTAAKKAFETRNTDLEMVKSKKNELQVMIGQAAGQMRELSESGEPTDRFTDKIKDYV